MTPKRFIPAYLFHAPVAWHGVWSSSRKRELFPISRLSPGLAYLRHRPSPEPGVAWALAGATACPCPTAPPLLRDSCLRSQIGIHQEDHRKSPGPFVCGSTPRYVAPCAESLSSGMSRYE